MEEYIAKWVVHEYKSSLWQLPHAITSSTKGGRVRRNILGDMLGSLTGLVTDSQFVVEHRALQETKSKLKKLLDHQIDLEQLLNNSKHCYQRAVSISGPEYACLLYSRNSTPE